MSYLVFLPHGSPVCLNRIYMLVLCYVYMYIVHNCSSIVIKSTFQSCKTSVFCTELPLDIHIVTIQCTDTYKNRLITWYLEKYLNDKCVVHIELSHFSSNTNTSCKRTRKKLLKCPLNCSPVCLLLICSLSLIHNLIHEKA